MINARNTSMSGGAVAQLQVPTWVCVLPQPMILSNAMLAYRSSSHQSPKTIIMSGGVNKINLSHGLVGLAGSLRLVDNHTNRLNEHHFSAAYGRQL